VYRVMSMAHDEPGADAVVAQRCDDQSLTFYLGQRRMRQSSVVGQSH